ncbi:MAG: hypothetical protein KF680_11310 [Cryobacterium sp.]|nr:hypothetical protein [Cryobacterium sp.]
MSTVVDYVLAFINWCSWMAYPAVWVGAGGAVLILGALVIIARARHEARWSGPQYRRNG